MSNLDKIGETMVLLSRGGVLSGEAPRVLAMAELLEVFDRRLILDAVRGSLIDHSMGKMFGPAPSHIAFEAPRGDCHVKVAGKRLGKRFVVKLSCGFYENAKLGLATNNGLQLLIDAETGHPLAVLSDGGLLTSWRTVAAAIAAAALVSSPKPVTAGIVGCGEQGELIATWLPDQMSTERLLLWNRTGTRAEALAAHLRRLRTDVEVEIVPDVATVIANAQIVFASTPAERPLVTADMIAHPLHLIALGADAPGKNEIEAAVFGRADWIATDDHNQCIHHGEFGNAVRAGIVGPDTDRPLGALLADRPVPLKGLSIVDLTGIAAQDLAMANLFYDRIVARG